MEAGVEMIRKTLLNTQQATFSVDLPDSRRSGIPSPTGTGFFVSPDGWFVTAAHVVTMNNAADGTPRTDINQVWLMQPTRSVTDHGGMCQFVTLDHIDAKNDFALLKVDFQKNSNKEWLKGRTAFPFIQVSQRVLEDGEPVYSFGYPLSEANVLVSDGMIVGFASHSPRVTSAIVSSTLEKSTMVTTARDPRLYVLDKALNYGNSGGPIVAVETGNVHALCSRFQPVFVLQPHLSQDPQKPVHVMIPSLYSIVSSLSNLEVLEALDNRGVSISDK